ncbi:MAG: hypothetical protein HQK75_01060 [Candidatus Magnetomorum sp.]|nr:hypothetical protein [Candidatus Magnetomorum sp.]
MLNRLNPCISIILIVSVSLFHCGCSKKWIVTQGINFALPVILETGLDSFLKESDPVVAETAIASNLKLLEVMLESTPKNELLLNNIAFAYCAYALSFVEYKMEKGNLEGNDEQKDFHRNRARNLYLRARNYGFRSLQLTPDGRRLVSLITAETIDMDGIENQLKYILINQHHALFWTTISWGSYLQISRDNLSELALVPIFRMMNKRIQELDKQYFFAMPIMIDAMLYAMSPMFGGDEAIADEKFSLVSEINDGKCLLNPLFKAKFFCTQFDYPDKGVSLLKDIIEQDTSDWPDKYNLINVIAKRKAKLYLKYADDIF